MSRSISIHIGLNQVNPDEYAGWAGALPSPEADAVAMEALAAAQGISRRVLLLAAQATYAKVMAELECAAAALEPGGYLLLTFAGHGASFVEIPTATSAPAAATADPHAGDEADGRDEAWCLYDTYLLDDELHDRFVRLAPGARVCVVSDSCFSGTVIRGGRLGTAGHPTPAPAVIRDPGPAPGLQRRVEPWFADALYRRHYWTRYRPRRAAAAASRRKRSDAHIVLLAACKDDQTAGEGHGHGLFTEKLLDTWANGQFVGNHAQLIKELQRAMPPRQQPNLCFSGAPDTGFQLARPFTP